MGKDQQWIMPEIKSKQKLAPWDVRRAPQWTPYALRTKELKGSKKDDILSSYEQGRSITSDFDEPDLTMTQCIEREDEQNKEMKKYSKRFQDVPELYGDKQILCVENEEYNKHKLPGILEQGSGYIRGAPVKIYELKKTQEDVDTAKKKQQ